VTAVEVYREAAAGDPLAVSIADAAGRWVARAVHELVMTYDVPASFSAVASAGAVRPSAPPWLAALEDLRAASGAGAARPSPKTSSISGCPPRTPMPAAGARDPCGTLGGHRLGRPRRAGSDPEGRWRLGRRDGGQALG
jgi:predicted NBD/HSP70 family sugar kinase